MRVHRLLRRASLPAERYLREVAGNAEGGGAARAVLDRREDDRVGTRAPVARALVGAEQEDRRPRLRRDRLRVRERRAHRLPAAPPRRGRAARRAPTPTRPSAPTPAGGGRRGRAAPSRGRTPCRRAPRRRRRSRARRSCAPSPTPPPRAALRSARRGRRAPPPSCRAMRRRRRRAAEREVRGQWSRGLRQARRSMPKPTSADTTPAIDEDGRGACQQDKSPLASAEVELSRARQQQRQHPSDASSRPRRHGRSVVIAI